MSNFTFISIRIIKLCLVLTLLSVLPACINLDLGANYTTPFHRQVLIEGDSKKSIAVIDVDGVISTQGSRSFFGRSLSTVEHVAMQLRAAARDKKVKTVLIKVNSPGGGITASDIIYQEILEFKRISNKKVVTAMMDVAASGGYYIALPSDLIIAHPSSITGSVGVIMVRPNVTKLMDKIGLDYVVYKSGESKDAGSPYREPTQSDIALMKNLNVEMAGMFHGLVQKHRKLNQVNMDQVKTARIFTGIDAQKIGLVDKVGYLSDAIAEACKLAGGYVNEQCEVIAYRRRKNANDTVYHSNDSIATEVLVSLPDMLNSLKLKPGHYYLWPAGI